MTTRPERTPVRPEDRLETHRIELTGFCYRMLGSAFDAEDAVQETMTRAWRSLDRFEGRSELRTWMYRIANNVCIDMIQAGRRRALPMDLGAPPGSAEGPIGGQRPAGEWVLPVPDARVVADDADPAVRAQRRESLRLAVVAAMQHLPPRQRAVLVLREALGWRAAEVAELLDTSVASVNSALQRARATLQARGPAGDAGDPEDAATREMLARYLDAFERYDMDDLAALLHEDATQSMPPYELWLRGRHEILRWWRGPGAGCRGSRLVPTRANGRPAFGQYRPSGPGGAHRPWSLQVPLVAGGRIIDIVFYLDTATLFPLFGLPATLD